MGGWGVFLLYWTRWVLTFSVLIKPPGGQARKTFVELKVEQFLPLAAPPPLPAPVWLSHNNSCCYCIILMCRP